MTRKKKQVDYRSFLFLAVSLISIGLILAIAINLAFVSILASGLCITAIYLANKEKRNQNNKQNASNNSVVEVR
ncbi:hypothetical protein E2P64_02655 [Candidatus Bathyarchaeota archaeon]|nr:hypothetical protein E2P64_02655 [Candidatus Bathyarchaeota archaeon]